MFGCAPSESYKQGHVQRRMSSRDGGHPFKDIPAMQNVQNVQTDNLDSMPLRQSSHSVGTIAIRFVGLLALAVVAMALIWSR